MDRLVCFSLLLSYLPVTESMNGCLLQPNDTILRQPGQRAVLKCTVNSHCSGLRYLWFKENLRLNLSDKQKYSLDGASLNIKSLQVEDTGIYHCAALVHGNPASGNQHVGLGTTLVVMEIKTMLMYILWASFALLAIYSLAVVTLMIKKYGCNMSVCRRIRKTDENSAKKDKFHDVLQEMYSRRNLDKGKKTVSRNRSQAEAASSEVKNSNEDIYENF
ncbi:uncharacterized protein si:ch211-139g16.8 isoform X2 [Anoplopoma fimbria]|uniref:uncharacterized protein si:ch211-139g16.8 isoform X2 n=1 Tax=Anoplopoma fimbria TaxID=229290 RepID=UPI0023EDEC6D|nr:uncharacterized protein si:ch211-139g16.8 isoform X2 [Anoplopoma fimbria]